MYKKKEQGNEKVSTVASKTSVIGDEWERKRGRKKQKVFAYICLDMV